MLKLVWFFDRRLWREVVVSIRCLAQMCRSFWQLTPVIEVQGDLQVRYLLDFLHHWDTSFPALAKTNLKQARDHMADN